MQVKIFTRNKGVHLGVVLMLVGGLLGACSAGTMPARSDHAGANQTSAGDGGAATIIRVTATEMSFSLDPLPTRAGRFTFIIENRGHIQHNFVLKGGGQEQATRMIDPGSSQTLTVDLGTGQYDFVCGVLGHGIAGMRGSFTLN